MPIIVNMDLGLPGASTSGVGGCGKLVIARLEPLHHGRDIYTYSVKFTAEEWTTANGTYKTAKTKIRAAYSKGLLNLVAEAIKALLSAYPELKSGRYGVPRNRIKCRKCGTVLWSQFRHDFTSCRCKAVSVDGGYDYKHIGGKRNDFEIVTEPWQKPRKRRG